MLHARGRRGASITLEQAAARIDTDAHATGIEIPRQGRETIGYLVANNDLAVEDAAALIQRGRVNRG